MAMTYRCVAGMATMPSRSHSAPKALETLMGQFATIHLVLNGYRKVPGWAKVPGVSSFLPEHGTDYGAAGKLVGLSLETSLKDVAYFCVDDDMLYPSHFARRLLQELQNEPNSIVGVHGSIIKHPFRSWSQDRKVVSAAGWSLMNRQVDVVATNGCAFLAEKLPLPAADWPREYRNCVDLHLSQRAKRSGLQRRIIRHRWRWIKSIELKQHDSIYRRLLTDDTLHTNLALDLLAPDQANNPETAAKSGISGKTV